MNMPENFNELTYFPGCSLATTARENDRSLYVFCERHGIKLNELEDWNCCGSSSTHSIDHYLSDWLPSRNLSLAPPGRPLMAACPNCYRQLKLAHLKLLQNPSAQESYKQMWGREFDPELNIITFFELLSEMVDAGAIDPRKDGLKGLKVAAYYGCMLARPPVMRHEKNFYGFMEKVLSALNSQPVQWEQSTRCCGTFLTVTRPDITNKTIQGIIDSAEKVKAECIVTACAMCHMNLEIRSKLPGKTPIFHFSELLSLSMGIGGGMGWFRRHLIDPRPLLRSRRLIG
jgi:heterodisulfide reductase subunit B